MMKQFTQKLALILLISLFFNAFTSFSQKITHLQSIKNYLSVRQKQLGLSQKDVESIALTYEYTDPGTGIQHTYSAQKLNGLTITDANFALHTAGTAQTETNKLIAIDKYKTVPVNAAVSAQSAVLKLMVATAYTGDKNISVKQPLQQEVTVTLFSNVTILQYGMFL